MTDRTEQADDVELDSYYLLGAQWVAPVVTEGLAELIAQRAAQDPSEVALWELSR